MPINESLLQGYENTRLVHYNDLREIADRVVNYDDLADYDGPGVLKYNCRVDGTLKQIYTALGNHVGVIAATRMGKSTSVVIPYIRSFAKMKKIL